MKRIIQDQLRTGHLLKILYSPENQVVAEIITDEMLKLICQLCHGGECCEYDLMFLLIFALMYLENKSSYSHRFGKIMSCTALYSLEKKNCTLYSSLKAPVHSPFLLHNFPPSVIPEIISHNIGKVTELQS